MEHLAKHYSEEQLMSLMFTVGQYNLVSMALNSFGVQLDEDATGSGYKLAEHLKTSAPRHPLVP